MAEARFNPDESPVARLARRRGREPQAFLDAAEANAAERLRRDFTRAGLTPRITQSWDWSPRGTGGPGGADEIGDLSVDSRKKLGDALDAVGPDLSGLVLDVCCFLKGLSQVERERGWPARSAKLVLKIALATLARHYGFTEPPPGGEVRIRRWQAAGAKPSSTRGICP